jgi:low molecular weight protein-tyrosine phosphatase
MKKVVFVCLGNICRSPLAEGIFRDKVKQRGLEKEFEIDSCGTAAYHIGQQPDQRSVENARLNGIELNHKARQFSFEDFGEFDYIIVMDKSNLRNIQSLEQDRTGYELVLMRNFDVQGINQDVPDPYYGGDNGFQEVFEILDRSTASLLDHLLTND